MEIVDKRTHSKIKFDDLNVGDVFCCERCYYMKINEENEYNAISISSATNVYFSDFEPVTKVNAKLVIED